MKRMVRRIFGAALALCLSCAAAAAQETKSPPLSGIRAVTAGEPETVKTGFGTFLTKAGTEIGRYESGAVKSFFIEGRQDIRTPAGTFAAETPEKPAGRISTVRTQPVELYESGALKAVYLAGSSAPGERAVDLNLPVGRISCRTRDVITFHENGAIASCTVADGQTAKFLTDLDPKAKFKGGTEISFYDDRKIRSFTPTVTLAPDNPLGLKSKAGCEIVLGRDGRVISFVPPDKSALRLDEKTQVSLIDGRPVEFYESGALREIAWSYTGQSFDFGAPFCGTDDGREYRTILRFFENERLMEIDCPDQPSASGLPSLKSKKGWFVTEIGGKKTEVERIAFTEDGQIKSILYRTPVVFSSKKIDGGKIDGVRLTGTQSLVGKKVFFIGGRKAAITGFRKEEYGAGGGFYDTSVGCIFICDDDEVTKTVEVESPRFFADCEVLFDGGGNPVAYTARDDGGNTVEVRIP